MKKMKKFLMSTLLMVGLIVIPTMTFNAAGQINGEAKLSNITLSAGSITFSENTADYSVTVPYATSTIEVTGTLKDSTSYTVEGNGTKSLNEGPNTIVLTVKNSDSSEVSTYEIIVTREAAPVQKEKAKLTGLTVTGQTIDFKADTLVYNLTVENSVSEVTVTGTAASADYTVEGNGKHTLKEGSNVIEIKVKKGTDEDTLSTYTINITRKAAVTNPVIEELEEALKTEFDGKVMISGEPTDFISFIHVETLTDGTVVNKYFIVDLAEDDTVATLLPKIEKALGETKDLFIELPSTGILSKETLALVKQNGTEVMFSTGGNFYWTIDGSKIADYDKEINFNVRVDEEVNKELKETIESLLVDKTKSIVLDFDHNGDLPKGTKVSLYVGDRFKENDVLTLYYYNPTTKKLEERTKNIKVNEAGYVEFDLEHCSSYVLTATSNNAQTGAMNVVFYGLLAVSSLALIAFLIKRKAN